MLFQVVIENGVKKIKPLTADTGTGAPVGSYLMLEKKSNPQGYLYCDGSTFDANAYPALYQYLGTNVLPDWREFSPVGAEQNTTNVYDAGTNPDGVIHDHDVYTEGQAKDDQLQDHKHYYADIATTSITASGLTNALAKSESSTVQGVDSSVNPNTTRVGTVTRGKRKAVFIYIKATSGLTENQQENVLNTINENLSYSTTEHLTGKKWIDGKDIYAKTYVFLNQTVTSTPSVIGLISGFTENDIVKKEILAKRAELVTSEGQVDVYISSGSIYASQTVTGATTGWNIYYTLEYTKTN